MEEGLDGLASEQATLGMFSGLPCRWFARLCCTFVHTAKAKACFYQLSVCTGWLLVQQELNALRFIYVLERQSDREEEMEASQEPGTPRG